MSVVELSFSPLPAHVRTARLIATAVARRADVPPPVVDEIRLAVGEACSRAVGLHAQHAPAEPVRLELSVNHGRYQVTVTDVVDTRDEPSSFDDMDVVGVASAPAHDGDDPLPSGIGLAVISGLVDQLDVERSATGGTHVRMSWPCGEVSADTVLAQG